MLGFLVSEGADETSSTIDAADQTESGAGVAGPVAVLAEPVVTCPMAGVVPASLPRGIVVESFDGLPGFGGGSGMWYEWQQAGREVSLFVGSLGRNHEYVPPDGFEALDDPPRHLSPASHPSAVVEGRTGRPYRCEHYRLEVSGDGEEARELAVTITAALRFVDPAEVPANEAGEGSVFLSPDGPYTDEQEVTVLVPRGLAADWHNDGPRFCSIADDVESCDPTWDGGGYAGIGTSASGDTRKVVVRRWTFTPTGWRDCALEAVTCFFQVARDGGGFAASEEVRFRRTESSGPVAVQMRPPRIAGTSTVMLAAPVRPDPSWSTFAREHPDRTSSYPPFGMSVCAFVDRRSHDCDFGNGGEGVVVGADGMEVQVSLGREFFGFRGWHDCAEEACFVLIRARTVQRASADSILGGDSSVAAAPLGVDPDVPAPPRPAITIVDPPPFEPGQPLRVRVDHVPDGRSFQLAICHQDPQVADDCGYFETEVRAPVTEGVIELFASYHPEECAAGRCYLAVMPGQEGAGPVATASLEFAESPDG